MHLREMSIPHLVPPVCWHSMRRNLWSRLFNDNDTNTRAAPLVRAPANRAQSSTGKTGKTRLYTQTQEPGFFLVAARKLNEGNFDAGSFVCVRRPDPVAPAWGLAWWYLHGASRLDAGA